LKSWEKTIPEGAKKMQEITSKQVEQTARMARLALTEAELEAYTRDMAALPLLKQRLAACPTQDVEPTFYGMQGRSTLRPDRCQPSMPQELVLMHAPDRQEDFFRVPRMLED
jgi:aspartyl-tRNA(Asn)/glutamyl-tRNA(Gln) amidotransferase subunit C